LRREIVDDIDNEQRQPAGVIVQLVNESFVNGRARQLTGQVFGYLDLGERIEHDLFTQAVQTQLLTQLLQRMRLSYHLHEPERAEPHDSRRRRAPREVVQQPQRGVVAPVQVFRD
jgi:hypothetical protein